jgi:pyrimidine deaminase RibD-like protein
MNMDYTVAMQRAIALAEKGLGKTAPNPIVGAVIIDASGAIVAEGFHDRNNQRTMPKSLRSKQQEIKQRVQQLL